MTTKSIVLLAVLLAIPAFRQAHAQDALADDKVSITGSIIQETGSNGATTIKPITIANIIGVLGLTGTAPSAKTLRYYLDATANSIVIAPKTLAVSGSGTPVATVYTINDANVSWQPSAHSAINEGNNNTLLNDNLQGAHLLHGVLTSRHVETDRRQFIASGTISGVNTIMKGTIVDIYRRVLQ